MNPNTRILNYCFKMRLNKQLIFFEKRAILKQEAIMKKSLFVLSLVLVLTGCSKETKNITEKFILPDGLKDCQVYFLQSSAINHIQVVRCPNSDTTTSYSSGKTRRSVTVVEEKEASLKESALNKLSAEEKQALGLKE